MDRKTNALKQQKFLFRILSIKQSLKFSADKFGTLKDSFIFLLKKADVKSFKLDIGFLCYLSEFIITLYPAVLSSPRAANLREDIFN